MPQSPNFTLHEMDIIFSLVDDEINKLDERDKTSSEVTRMKELQRIRTKIEENAVI